MKLYRTRTQEEYDWLMQKLEDEGYKWFGGNKPTEKEDLIDYTSKAVIYLSTEKELTWDFIEDVESEKISQIIEVSDLMSTVDHDTLMQKVMERNNKPETLKELTEPLDLIDSHKRVCERLNKVYADKNHDYGNSFGETYEKYGDISALVRISDKMNRIEQLATAEDQKVNDESLEDSILDMANYLIMWAMELEEEE